MRTTIRQWRFKAGAIAAVLLMAMMAATVVLADTPTISVVTDPVVVSEGDTAANTGTYFDVDDAITLTADVGIVVDGGVGTWSWSFATTDDSDSGPVTITITDAALNVATLSFTLTVNDVPPTISSVTNSGPVAIAVAAVITVTAAAGPSDSLSYEFDCDNDATYEIGPQGGNTASCTYGTVGFKTVPVRVTDEDGFTVATSSTDVSVVYFGKSKGYWGNKNGNASLIALGGLTQTIGGGTRSVFVDTILENNTIMPKTQNACDASIFDCAGTPGLSLGLNRNSLNVLAAQTLALSYNIALIPIYTGQTVGALGCASLAIVPLTVTGASTVDDVLVEANLLIDGSTSAGTTTQAQAEAMNALLECLNRQS